jgi:hypothetical protein
MRFYCICIGIYKPMLKQHTMVMYGKAEVKLHVFLASILDGVDWSTSHASHFTTGTNWRGSWVGPKADVDVMMEQKFLPPLGPESHYPACSQSVY